MKVIRYFTLLLLSLAILGFFIIYFVASDINEKTVYSKSDFIKYYVLTDSDIAKSPLISNDYYFESVPGDGHSPSNAVIYRNAKNISQLQNYLKSIGYERRSKNFGESEVWERPDEPDSDTFYLWYNKTDNEISLTKELKR